MSRRHLGIFTAAVLAAASLTACGGSGDDSAAGDRKTLTYWASNQGTSLEADKQILQPELDKFEKQTGIKVNLEVVPWSDLLNRLLAAATSGQGPGRGQHRQHLVGVAAGHRRARRRSTTPPCGQVGGKDRFVPAALAATGAPGKPPAAVPLYSLAYGLYYNKKMFADAGITEPPTTWEQLVADGKKLTKRRPVGPGRRGRQPVGERPPRLHLRPAVRRRVVRLRPASRPSTPRRTSPAIKRYIDLMAVDKIVNPSNAEYADRTSRSPDFANGKAAMLLWQAAGST